MTTTIYDVAIIGGGPIGLSAAYELATQRGKQVIVFDQASIPNNQSSSPGFSRQWRVPYSELWLAELAIQASSAWNDLMKQTSRPHLLDRTGVLWFGNPDVTTPEGNISEAAKNMEILKQEYSVLTATELKNRFPWLTNGVDLNPENQKSVGLFAPDGGTINVQATIYALLDSMFASKRAIIRENTQIVEITNKENEGVTLKTDDGEIIQAKKLILTPGVHINNVLDTISPAYPKRLNMIIYQWVSSYFGLKLKTSEYTKIPNRLSRPSTDKWPVWIYFGIPQIVSEDVPSNGNSYYGFPSDVQDAPFNVRICPGFTSSNKFDFVDRPPLYSEREVDIPALNFTKEFVRDWMTGFVDSDAVNPKKTTTCLAGFAQSVDPEHPDEGEGFVLDILPETFGNIVVCTGGWAMKFVPLFGRILSDLVLNGTAPNYKIANMCWDRGITKNPEVCTKKNTALPHGVRFLHQSRVSH